MKFLRLFFCFLLAFFEISFSQDSIILDSIESKQTPNQNCQNHIFNLRVNHKEASVREVLERFSNECFFSLSYNDPLVDERLDLLLTQINLKEKSLDSIFSLLFDIANLNYSFFDDILRLDYLTTRTFRIDYIATARFAQSGMSVLINNEDAANTTSYGSGSSRRIRSNEASSATNKSGIDITSSDDFDFWGNIISEISSLIESAPQGSQRAPNTSANAPNFAQTNAITNPLNLTQNTTKINTQNAPNDPPRVIINKNAGLISVRGDRNSLKRVETYIKHLHSRLKQQVFIDVNILSLTHRDSQTTGVNWGELYNLQNLIIQAPQAGVNALANGASGLSIFKNENGSAINYALNIFSSGVSLQRIVEFLNTYGNVKSISNPKILTLNNQPALISVGDILRYRRSSVYQNINSQSTLTNTDNDYPSVFAGILLDITPLVFGEEIMLKINPSITQTIGNIAQSPTALESPPNLTTNQLSSLVLLQNGQKVVFGGLISENKSLQENSVPLLGSLPLLGLLFSYSQEISQTQEIIFIVEPKIVQSPLIAEDLGYKLIESDLDSIESVK